MMRRSMIAGVLAALAVLRLSGTALTGAEPQSAASAVDVEQVGPKVGDAVPHFSLPDQHGATRTLASLIGPKGAILVFFRSADW
ncbi:MAG: hypothetical protein ACRD2N_03510 [Vicinamibacterales bacterium]